MSNLSLYKLKTRTILLKTCSKHFHPLKDTLKELNCAAANWHGAVFPQYISYIQYIGMCSNKMVFPVIQSYIVSQGLIFLFHTNKPSTLRLSYICINLNTGRIQQCCFNCMLNAGELEDRSSLWRYQRDLHCRSWVFTSWVWDFEPPDWGFYIWVGCQACCQSSVETTKQRNWLVR